LLLGVAIAGCVRAEWGARILARHKTIIMRQSILRENDPGRGVSVSTLSRDYPCGSFVPPHAHGSDLLIYASRGIMEVTSDQNVWIIPPHFGLWVPARTMHQISMPERVSMRTIYLRRGVAVGAPSCAVLHVGPLLRELIVEIVRVEELRVRNRAERAVRELLVVELERASAVPTNVTLPKDARARRVADWVIANLSERQSLATMCAHEGVSVRTLERLFRREVGSDFETWRRQVRLMRAVELLVSGCSMKQVARSVGYQNPGSFVTLFRATFGTTPRAWMAKLERLA
jgi:AraC-like DNA-binding protein